MNGEGNYHGFTELKPICDPTCLLFILGFGSVRFTHGAHKGRLKVFLKAGFNSYTSRREPLLLDRMFLALGGGGTRFTKSALIASGGAPPLAR